MGESDGGVESVASIGLETRVFVPGNNNYPDWVTSVQEIIETSTRSERVAAELKVDDLLDHPHLLTEDTLGVLAHGFAAKVI